MVLVRTLRVGKPLNHDSCTLAFGGAESNVAVALSRLGHRVRWMSLLGSDSFGDMIEGVLVQEGVEVVAPRSPDRPTGLMVKSPSTGHDRFVTYYRAGSAASELSMDSVSDSSLRDARLLHLTGIMPAISASARELSLDVASRARQLGLAVSLDLNYRHLLWPEDEAAPVLRKLARSADFVFGDRAELELLVGDQTLGEQDLLKSVAALGPSQVVLKKGEAGAMAYVQGELIEQSAMPVQVVDTVGAGDAFVAGYLSGWLDSAGPSESLARGVICGARACEDPGDWEGAPTRAQLELTQMELAS
ncbi:MAG: hypothetical protein RL247_870 [Actinomycetota bacterium]